MDARGETGGVDGPGQEVKNSFFLKNHTKIKMESALSGD
jgi:hypothetical protein